MNIIKKYFLCLVIFSVFCFSSNAYAQNFSANCQLEDPNSFDSNINLVISAKGSMVLPKSFSIYVSFDNAILKKSSKIEYEDIIKKNYTHKKMFTSNDVINIQGNLRKYHSSPTTNDTETTLMTLKFSPKKSRKSSSLAFKINIKSNEYEEESFVSNVNLKSKETPPLAKLLSIVPEFGNLEPSFAPDVTEYKLEVESDISSIDFETTPKSSNQKVEINRHKLNAAGKSTDIYITVADISSSKSKNTYHINVNRRSPTVPTNSSDASVSEETKNSSTKKDSNTESKSNSKDISAIHKILRKIVGKENEESTNSEDNDNEESKNSKPTSQNVVVDTIDDTNEGNHTLVYIVIFISAVGLIFATYFTIKFIKKYKAKKENST